MKTGITMDANRICYTRGGGCLAWIGVPTLLIGLLFLVVGLTSTEPSKDGGKEASKDGGNAIVLIFGGVMAALGIGLAFGRGGAIVDKQQGCVTTWWGVLVPFRRKHTPLAEVNKVAVTGLRRRVKGGGWFTVYYLCLEGPTGKSIRLTYNLSEPNIHQLGVELSTFLGAADAEGTAPAQH